MLLFFACLFVLFAIVIGAILAAHSTYQLYAITQSAPFVPSAKDRIDSMLGNADLKPGMRVLELGSGHGELCIQSALRGAIAHGLELNPFLVLYSRLRARLRHVQEKATFSCENFWKVTLHRDTDIVFFYLLPAVLERVWQKLCHELKPGTIVISNAFAIPNVEPLKKDGMILIYKIPAPPSSENQYAPEPHREDQASHQR